MSPHALSPLSRRIPRVFLLVILSILLVHAVQAADRTVIAMDISQDMAVSCAQDGANGLDLARKQVLRRLDVQISGADRSEVRVLAFAETVTVLPEEAEARRQALTALQPVAGPASLAAALEGALQLLPDGAAGREAREIVLYTAGGGNDAKALLAMMDEVTARGVRLRLNLFRGKGCNEITAPPAASQLIAVSSFCCPEDDPFLAKEQEIFSRIRERVADYLEVDAAQVRRDADLIDTLGADHYEAFELLAMLCDDFRIALPHRIDLTKVGDIVDYVTETSFRPQVAATATDAATRGEAEKNAFEVPVYFATNRNRTGSSTVEEFFGPDRAPDHELAYGRGLISIPANHKKGQVEQASFGLKFLEDPKKHVILLSVEPLAREAFLDSLKKAGDPKDPQSRQNDLLIFIHGFNNSFGEAMKRTAQIALDLEFAGTPVLFTWPSDASVFHYWQDREEIIWSVGHMERILNEITALAGQRRVHLITHSMGNQGTLNALHRLAMHRKEGGGPLFANVVLAAPDFDADLFNEQIAPEIISLAENWTIYASDKDKALEHSTNLTSAVRLGMPLTFVDGMQIIDASGVDVSPWNIPQSHGYYATKQTVIRDLIGILQGVPPERRQDLKTANRDAHHYWQLKTPGL